VPSAFSWCALQSQTVEKPSLVIAISGRQNRTVLALILDSLGSTELLFILVVALIFFGPRKLPQLARSMGKSLAEFRRASDDFKRTWEREVALESARADSTENSILGDETQSSPYTDPATVEQTDPDLVVARQNPYQQTTTAVTDDKTTDRSPSEPQRKHDWL
jgi:TatA/E family protein of Tat protein translocase